VFVYADIEMIRLVIRNIFSNAAKFTSEDGTITIKSHTENDLVWIRITDNGKGLTPIELEKINSKTSFSTPGTNNEKGTGLGLILCKDFLHVNNGQLLVTSEMQKGTTFAFSLPLYTGQDENADKQKDNIRALIRSKDRAKTFSDMY
jgi:signal transduction histidine kinase